MRYDAVIFDLFGTLVPTPSPEPFVADHRRTAELLGVDGDAYLEAWYSQPMALRRSIGLFPDIAQAIKAVCDGLGVEITAQQLDEAVARRIETTRQVLMTPRHDALDTLDSIGQAGLRRGLISDCSAEVPEIWPETPFAGRIDAAAFSSKEGMKKPDRRLYENVCWQLHLQPDQCLFVGDGACPELTGALEAGMDAVLICPPQEAGIILGRDEGKNWQGPVISSLSKLLGMI